MPPGSSPAQPAVGDRVVIRYRLGDDAPADWRDAPNPPVADGPSQSDITGILRERTDDAYVIERDGRLHRLPVTAISSVRLLSRRVVRNSEIREVERALMLAAPAAERDEIDGWLLNAPGDDAGHVRSGVAAPIDFGSTSAGLPGAVAWLTVRGLPARVMLAERLLRPSALGAAIGVDAAYEVLIGPEPTGPTPTGDWSLIADRVAAATVSTADDPARDAWRARGFELHHTCRLLTL
ncbi:GNAT family N-acetyltransferase, cg3035/Rv0428c family [Gordonia hydrophobica]|uniref:GCN5 family acetyltransferase n=1 Tax=Gordonia hydrophobica TaxID=40516 RepID=A0ABZ2U525_9ACTN|nr:GCN5 family acetyltransferase [Gordonia hydrophobica]MBM7368061.1 hypothetical protein [Gordonia hydrophobica]